MQQTKFTPGPWSVELIRPDKEKGQDIEPRCSIVAPNPDPNPHYSGRLRIADIPDPCTDEEVANAHLMAAAPELLEALQYAKGDLAGLLELFGNRMEPEARDVVKGTIADAAAAISKATGAAA